MAKGKNIVLGVVVVAVWGVIAFKIISYLNKSNVVELPTSNAFKTAGIKVKREKFKLDEPYRDPFLNEIKEKIAKPEQNSYRDIDFQIAKPQVKWPDIKFNGVIEATNKTKKVGLLQVNKKVFIVNDGDSADLISVVKMYKDSIRLKLSNEVKVYSLQK